MRGMERRSTISKEYPVTLDVTPGGSRCGKGGETEKGRKLFQESDIYGYELWECIYRLFFKGQYITLHISAFVEISSGHQLLYIPYGFLEGSDLEKLATEDMRWGH